MAILAKNSQILTIFGHFRGQKFFDQNNFWWSSKSYGDTTSCKKLEKKILNGQGCSTGTHVQTYVCTNVRTHKSEFIGSFRGTKKGPKWAKKDFSGKIWKRHFNCIRKHQLCAKFQKISMNGFWDLWVTHIRTYGRTYGCEFIGSARYRGEPKMN